MAAGSLPHVMIAHVSDGPAGAAAMRYSDDEAAGIEEASVSHGSWGGRG